MENHQILLKSLSVTAARNINAMNQLSKNNIRYTPVVESEWWDSHVEYSTFNRQGIDLVSANFRHPSSKAIVIILTGWSETFLKYAEMIRNVYEHGFTVSTYDHQSQVKAIIELNHIRMKRGILNV